MFNSLKAISILTGSLFLLLIITSCDSGNIQTNSTPAQIIDTTRPMTTINITRSQYDLALAKWHAQGVEEYEARIEYSAYSALMGIWMLHVRVTGDVSEVLDYKREPGLDAPTTGLGSQQFMPTREPDITELKNDLRDLTIESQFQAISQALDGKWKAYTDTSVSFDPQVGNPSSVAFDETYASEPSSWSIKEIKVLKNATPTPDAH